MSKFTNYLFLLLTVINFLSILAIFYLYQTKINLSPNTGTAKPTSASPKANLIIVDTKYGPIGGSMLSFEKKSIVSYLGIPYAQPPVGVLRHKAPLEASSWNGSIFQATSWPRPCLQPDNRLRLNNANFSEDCLYLNIWTPHQNGQFPGKKPVIVVIHTGAFIFGSASEATYNGLALAAIGDLVVVTFNYRLNYYGFFYTENEANEVVPNAGMLDQVAALKWIQANIDVFNGDPGRVTLIGQSSGALSVGLHITSPLSRTTFTQAIIMSGSPLQTPALNTPNHVARFWLNYARRLNCLPPSETVLSPAVHQCIDKILSVNRNLLPTMPQVKTLSADSLFVNLPIVLDDAFQPRSPVEALIADSSTQSVASNISLLFGYTNDEGSWIAALENAKKFGPKVTPSLSRGEARELIEIYLGKMKTTKAEINSTDMIQYYLSEMYTLQGHSTKDDSLVLSRLVSSVLGDHYIACPANLFASLLQASNASSSNVYQYYWTYKGNPRSSPFWSTFSNVWCGQWMGSCHSFEMFALFGLPFLEPSAFNADDRVVSMKTIQMVTYFANNGKLFWPKFGDAPSEGSQKVYYIMDNSVEQYNFGTDLKADVCDNIWKEYLL